MRSRIITAYSLPPKDSYTKKQLEKAGEKIVAEDAVLSVGYMHDIEKRIWTIC